MIPIKILCSCGQKYAFDVEPVNGRMPHAVNCPVCGADGTVPANEIIARTFAVQTPLATQLCVNRPETSYAAPAAVSIPSNAPKAKVKQTTAALLICTGAAGVALAAAVVGFFWWNHQSAKSQNAKDFVPASTNSPQQAKAEASTPIPPEIRYKNQNVTLPTGIVSSGRLSFTADDKGNLTFDTGVVKGSLQKDGRGEALKPISFIDPNVAIDNNHGLFIPYRFLTPQRRYGFGSWEWPRTGKVLDDGGAELRWAGTPDRPFNFSTVYRWKTADALDLTVFFTPQTNLDKFELFLGSYFQKFTKTKAYVQDAGNGSAGFVEAAKDKGDYQLFPSGEDVMPMINDGRWTFPPYPIHWALRTALAAPLGMKLEPKSGVTVLIMAPPEDCFAVSMLQQEAGLGSFYLSLFGKDVKPGQTLTGHARLVFGKNISDAQALQKYAEYLQDLKHQRDDALMSRAEMESLRAFSALPIAATKLDWISAQTPKPDADGWVALFDGKQLYGCSPPVADVESGKLSIQDGNLLLNSYGLRFNLSGRDVMIRARLKKVSGQNCGLGVRDSNEGGYGAWFNGGDFFGAGKTVDRQWKGLTTAHASENYPEFFEMAFRAEGRNLTLTADGRKVFEAQDSSFTEGAIRVQALKGITLFKSIEARVLDKQ